MRIVKKIWNLYFTECVFCGKLSVELFNNILIIEKGFQYGGRVIRNRSYHLKTLVIVETYRGKNENG